MNQLRIIFAGTSEFSVLHLKQLIHSGYEVVSVITKPDRPFGRGYKIKFNPVKKIAKQYRLPILQPESLLEKKIIEEIEHLNVDVIIVVSYGLIFPEKILKLPKFGCINVHGSLLPRWRGASPIHRALLANDSKTGITIIKMDKGIDTGEILYKVSCDIQKDDTYTSLYKKLGDLGPKSLLKTLSYIRNGKIFPKPQNNKKATYAHKVSKIESKINWLLPAEEINLQIRAFNCWPVSYFTLNNHIIKVISSFVNKKENNILEPGTILHIDDDGIHVSTGKYILVLTKLQIENRKAMLVKDLINSKSNWFYCGKKLY